jgi:hypothetical protein
MRSTIVWAHIRTCEVDMMKRAVMDEEKVEIAVNPGVARRLSLNLLLQLYTTSQSTFAIAHRTVYIRVLVLAMITT